MDESTPQALISHNNKESSDHIISQYSEILELTILKQKQLKIGMIAFSKC